MTSGHRGVYDAFLLAADGGRLIEAHLRRMCASVGGDSDPVSGRRAATDLWAQLPLTCAGLGPGEVVKLRASVLHGTLRVDVERPTPRRPLRLALVGGFDPGARGREHKCIDRAWAHHALAAARAQGADDALLIDAAGHLGEATSANVFLVLEDGTVATPPRGGIVPGVVRQWLLDECEVIERVLTVRDIEAAREVFLSTAGRGVVPIVAVKDRGFSEHSVTERLHARWLALPVRLPPSRP